MALSNRIETVNFGFLHFSMCIHPNYNIVCSMFTKNQLLNIQHVNILCYWLHTNFVILLFFYLLFRFYYYYFIVTNKKFMRLVNISLHSMLILFSFSENHLMVNGLVLVLNVVWWSHHCFLRQFSTTFSSNLSKLNKTKHKKTVRKI